MTIIIKTCAIVSFVSTCNGFLLCHSWTHLIQQFFIGLKAAISACCKIRVEFGYGATGNMLGLVHNSLKFICKMCGVPIYKIYNWKCCASAFQICIWFISHIFIETLCLHPSVIGQTVASHNRQASCYFCRSSFVQVYNHGRSNVTIRAKCQLHS